MLAEGFTVDAVFRDLDYGRWRGRGLAEIQESEPDSLMAWIGDAAAAPHGGESIAAAIIRIGDWLAGRMSAGGHTVAVTHPAIVRAAIVSILEAPHESFWKVDVRPFSIAEITGDGRRWALRSFGSPPD
jgi:broad specificity phosphatase PhoE